MPAANNPIPLRVNRQNVIHVVRTSIAAVVSLLIARLFKLPEAYWAAITTLVVMQSSLGAALTVSWQRFAGSAIGAAAGVGRIDLVENRFVGMKSRGCYETPGGTLIMAAHREIEGLTLDRSLSHYKQALALDYADLVYAGLWFTPLRESLDAFFTKATEGNTGEVTLRLYKGGFQPVSRKSPNSLYSLDIASFTMGAEYDQKDARGFINLIGLPMQVRALLKNRNKSKAKKVKRK